jgi:hypothetical protein
MRRILAVLLVVSGVCATLPLALNGPGMFVWDDTEYVTQALDTFEHVNEHGLLSWPGYVARHQLVKPPLYVNTLTAALFVFGSTRAALAAGVVGGVVTVLFGLVVYWLVSRLTNPRIGVAATAGMLALPAVARWFPAAYIDAQLSVLVLLALGLLAIPATQWSRGRVIVFGAVVGLALLSKTTSPVFLVLPLSYWILRRGEGGPPVRRRVIVALEAGAIAALVASTWYITQGEGALHYARVSSGFELGPVAQGVAGRFEQWAEYLVPRGWGYALIAIAAIGVVAGFQARVRAGYVVLFLLGAMPMLALGVWSRVPPNTRHPLPSLVLVAVAVLAFALSQVERSRWRRALWPVCLVIIGVQFVASAATQIPPVARAVLHRASGSWIRTLAPGLADHQPISAEAAGRVLERARTLVASPGGPTDWYVSGNTGYLNVSRLRLLARIQNVRANFLWGSYFTWTEAERRAKEIEMRGTRCVVVLYEPVTAPGTDMADLNRHNAEMRAFVTDPRNGFEPLESGPIATSDYSLALFIHRDVRHQ